MSGHSFLQPSQTASDVGQSCSRGEYHANTDLCIAAVVCSLVVGASNSFASDDWIDRLPAADASSKKWLRIGRAAADSAFAAVKSAEYDIEGFADLMKIDHAAKRVSGATPRKLTGKVRRKGASAAVRYSFVEKPMEMFGFLRTPDLSAEVYCNEEQGQFFRINGPPAGFRDWQRNSVEILVGLDPWIHFGGLFRWMDGEADDPRMVGQIKSVTATEGPDVVKIVFTTASQSTATVELSKKLDWLPVRHSTTWPKDGVQKLIAEVVYDWRIINGKAMVVKFADRQFVDDPRGDVTIRKCEFTASNILVDQELPASALLPHDLPINDGTIGVDRRKNPPLRLISADGRLRVLEPGERPPSKAQKQLSVEDAEASREARRAEAAARHAQGNKSVFIIIGGVAVLVAVAVAWRWKNASSN
jgi:hypothetical protein